MASALPATTDSNKVDVAYRFEDLSQLPELRRRIRGHVHAVIQCGLLPRSQTQAYMEAVARDPELVDTETDPLQFVRYCNFDIGAGAQRLCSYWTERVSLFGQERAFLPLTLTGSGALTAEDVQIVRAGYPAILPDSRLGHKCLYIDRRRKIPHATIESLLRAWFYVFAMISSSDLSQVEYVHVLWMCVTPRSHNFDWKFRHALTRIVSRCVPIRMKFYLLAIPLQKKVSFSHGLVKATVFLLQQYFSTTHSPLSVELLVEHEAEQILHRLLSFEIFDRSGIPQCFGGQWSFDDFTQWCRERKQMESELYKDKLSKDLQSTTSDTNGWIPLPSSASCIRNTTVCVDPRSTSSHEQDLPESTAPPTKKLKKKSDEHQDEESDKQPNKKQIERREKKRISNLIASRKVRERFQNQLRTLQEESSALESEKQRLLFEQEKLIGLVEQAQLTVQRMIHFHDDTNQGSDEDGREG